MRKEDGDNIVKTILKKLVRNIAIVGTVVAMIVLITLFFGPEVTLDLKFFTRLTVVSIILCISIIVVYELWCKTGQNKGREEKDYNELLKRYDDLSKNMDYATMQEYLDDEEKRRYNVEYERLSRLIDRDVSLLSKLQEDIATRKNQALSMTPKSRREKRLKRKLMRVSLEDKLKMMFLKRRIKINNRRRTTIVIKLPYVKSEEFDYLRYNLNSESFKEYSPDDTKRYLAFHRSKRYIQSITIAIFGINMLSFGQTMGGNIWYGIFMTILSMITLLMAVVSGYSVGYKSIVVISTGVYKTANEYICKAQVYCERNGKKLYYATAKEIEISEEQIEQVINAKENSEKNTEEEEKKESPPEQMLITLETNDNTIEIS